MGVHNDALCELCSISKAQMSMQLNGSTGPVLIPLFGNYSSIVFYLQLNSQKPFIVLLYLAAL